MSLKVKNLLLHMPYMHQLSLPVIDWLMSFLKYNKAWQLRLRKKEKSEAKCEAQKNVSRNLTRQLKRRTDALDRQKEETKTLKKEVITKDRDFIVTERIGLKR